jgi:hypothetical protein
MGSELRHAPHGPRNFPVEVRGSLPAPYGRAEIRPETFVLAPILDFDDTRLSALERRKYLVEGRAQRGETRHSGHYDTFHAIPPLSEMT